MSKKARITYLTIAWIFGFGGCATTETTPKPIPTVTPPEYVQVPHPAGFDLADITALFATGQAPAQEKLATCETDFDKLRKATLFPRNDEDFREGVAEFVKQDPVFYHWCFYRRIVELELHLRAEAYIEEKQKKVLDTYAYLVPVARGFMKEFRDSRYLRWAIRHYRQLSKWVFFQKLDQTPQMTTELVEVNNPFGVWREPAEAAPQNSVLEKYRLGKAKSADPEAPTASIFPATTPEGAAETPVEGTPPAPAAPPAAASTIPPAQAPAEVPTLTPPDAPPTEPVPEPVSE